MIAVMDVRKSFGRVTALEGVTLSIGRGERVGFVGPNGSGKTTLLRALLGLVRHEGRITIDGVDVARHPEVALRNVGYIAQIAPPLESPVREIVQVQAELRGRDARQTAERARSFGIDLEAIASMRFRDLSGGSKQKVLAAMALASRAPILVCDEPTANLDEAARRSFFSQIAELPAETIVILCSHRVDELERMVQRVVELQDGRIVADGPVVDADLGVPRLQLVRRCS